MNAPARLALLVALLLCLAPRAGAEDVVRFKNGRSLTGRIVAEDGDSVTIEIPGGGHLTLPRREIAEILRDVKRDDAGASPTGGLIRSEHFFVWSGVRRVGTRSIWVRKLENGNLSFEEESTFTDEAGKEEVRTRIMETVTAALEPIEVVYREISGGGQTLLRAEVRGETLQIDVSVPGNHRETSLSIPPGLRFPISAREFAVREREGMKGAWEVTVFDPREENFRLYRFEGAGNRRVDWEGAVTEVSVLRRSRGGRAPEEIWLDAKGSTLSEELNGPELVAVAATRERIDLLLAGNPVDPSEEEKRVRPLYVSPEAGFRVRKPTLSWTFTPGKPNDRTVLTIANLRWFAYVDVILLPDTPEGGLLSTLAVDMEKRFSAVSEGFRKVSDGYLEVGGEKAYRMEVTSRNRGEDLRSWLVGVLHRGRTWLIALGCPKAYWEGAKPEFEAILAAFEFVE